MLSKNHRLSGEDIERLFLEKKKKRYDSPLATLYIREELNKKTPTQFAFVVSKKTSKKSTERNKLKRRARYALQKHIKKIRSGHMGIFVFKEKAAQKPFYDVELFIVDLLKKATLL